MKKQNHSCITQRTLRVTLLTLLALSSYCAHGYEAPFAPNAPVIDGMVNDADAHVWASAKWEAIDQLTLGTQPSQDDFSGRFKVVWTSDKLYIMAEIIDDVLIDTHPDPLEQYWEDDTLEIFLDEDASGGNHLASYNAFAYHIALDNQVVDYNTSSQPQLFNDHVTSVWKRSATKPNAIIWEAAFDVYPDTFSDTAKGHDQAKPVSLTAGKKLGFMMAYCDSDGADGRQHFIGSHDIPAVDGDKNRGYIDASVFDTLTLVK